MTDHMEGRASQTTPGPLVLASASPRRRELLTQAGYPFEVRASDVDEGDGGAFRHPAAFARAAATLKAESVAADLERGVVVGADTIVVLDEHILGKPKDEEDAARMLSLLSGRTHQVITGLCVLQVAANANVSMAEDHVVTEVHVRPITRAEIEAYIATGEPMDKAGAYGIQGRAAVFISGVMGDYFNVVGLPLFTLSGMLSDLGLEPFAPR